ncbi:putative nuclease HARBI1 [Trichomycterus rosablanca]|uniref:putative nuclease HARBI1 n=1 Tax=Trichomycterus rosablanca TaxID=2290929 RepID=UPI002F360132
MACPFLQDPVDIEAQIIRRALRRERVIRPRLDILSFPDEFLRERYRFSSQSIIYLNNILKPHISNITHRGSALTSLQTLCIALRFFANRSFLYNVGDAEHLGKATVCRSVRKVCLALKRLLYNFVVFPGHKPIMNIKEEFHRIAGFPRVIGCMDGTHIPIKAPAENEEDYVNRKSFHSINIQIICDATNIITNVEAKWPGSVHDAGIFHESALYHTFDQGQYDGLILADRGYSPLPYVMTPYPDPGPGPQSRHKLALCRTRARVEMTIGILKARFQCLRGLRVTPERACDIIVACVVLHNIATIRREQHPAIPQIDDEEEPHLNVLEHRTLHGINRLVTRIKYNNDKPWFNAKLKQLRRSKEVAYRSGDRALYNQARNTLTKEIKAAKKNYSNKLSSMMSKNEPSTVCRTSPATKGHLHRQWEIVNWLQV